MAHPLRKSFDRMNSMDSIDIVPQQIGQVLCGRELSVWMMASASIKQGYFVAEILVRCPAVCDS
jgi:hypothetical protein